MSIKKSLVYFCICMQYSGALYAIENMMHDLSDIQSESAIVQNEHLSTFVLMKCKIHTSYFEKINALSDKQKLFLLCVLTISSCYGSYKAYYYGKSGISQIICCAKKVFLNMRVYINLWKDLFVHGLDVHCYNSQEKKHRKQLKKTKNNIDQLHDLKDKKNDFQDGCITEAHTIYADQQVINQCIDGYVDIANTFNTLSSGIITIDQQAFTNASTIDNYGQLQKKNSNERLEFFNEENTSLKEVSRNAQDRLGNMERRFTTPLQNKNSCSFDKTLIL